MPRRTPTPAEKAQRTAGWARTTTKWLITYTGRRGARWQVVNFTGPAGQESRGIVDLVAIRKDHRHEGRSLQRGDLFDIVLIQVKGGAARWPTADDVRRLRAVRAHHRARTL